MKKLCVNIICLCSIFVFGFSIKYANAAEQATILSGKVFSPVTRSEKLPFNAIIKEVLVTPGQKVTKGSVLLRYSLTEEAQRILEKELLSGAGTEDTSAQILTLQGQLANLRAQSNVSRQLAAAGLASSQASVRHSSEVNLLEQRIALLRQTLYKQENIFAQRLEELSSYYGQTITAGMPLPQILVFTAPMDGHVLSIANNIQPGQSVPAGTVPIVIGKMDTMLIQVQVYEGELGRIKVGNEAIVTIPSLQDKAFKATVSQISWTSSDLKVEAASYFTVQLTIPNPGFELKPGFKAVVQFNR